MNGPNRERQQERGDKKGRNSQAPIAHFQRLPPIHGIPSARPIADFLVSMARLYENGETGGNHNVSRHDGARCAAVLDIQQNLLVIGHSLIFME
ncbi:MAG: hypothetical protein WAT78_04765 [Rhizobiaceae bacterium]